MPDSLISIQDYATLLDERYHEAVELELASQKDVRPLIFKLGSMDRRTVRKTSIGAYGNIPEFTGQLAYDRPYEQYNVEAVARTKFDDFLKQTPAAAATIKTDTDREALFKQFQQWDADRNARAQARPAPATATQR